MSYDMDLDELEKRLDNDEPGEWTIRACRKLLARARRALELPSGDVDIRAVGRREGLLMAASWLDSVAHEAMKRRDRWLRSSEYTIADRCVEEARTAERIAQDLRYKAAYQERLADTP